jgi:hypothetical protein
MAVFELLTGATGASVVAAGNGHLVNRSSRIADGVWRRGAAGKPVCMDVTGGWRYQVNEPLMSRVGVPAFEPARPRIGIELGAKLVDAGNRHCAIGRDVLPAIGERLAKGISGRPSAGAGRFAYRAEKPCCSTHGAKIVVAPAVPDHFELAFSEGGQNRVCEVVWRRAKMIGVKFIF